jgi:hypothetical protein
MLTFGSMRMRALAAVLVLASSCGKPAADADATTASATAASASESTGGADSTGTTASDTSTSSAATSTADASTTDASDTTDGTKYDVDSRPEDIPMRECIECALTIASQQSGTFDVAGANIFATAQLMGQDVYALGTHGSGRFIATADSSLPFNEVSDCPILAWLAGTMDPMPTLFWFGWTPSDGPINWTYPGMSAGVHLPAQYVGDPAQLAADYDIVMYLEASGQFDMGDEPSDAEMQTLLDYVAIHGGGLYVSSEFADPNGGAYLNAADLASVNRVLVPMGLTALQVNLNWGNVDGNIDFACFPTPEG